MIIVVCSQCQIRIIPPDLYRAGAYLCQPCSEPVVQGGQMVVEPGMGEEWDSDTPYIVETTPEDTK